jgi:hypothetical protein
VRRRKALVAWGQLAGGSKISFFVSTLSMFLKKKQKNTNSKNKNKNILSLGAARQWLQTCVGAQVWSLAK